MHVDNCKNKEALHGFVNGFLVGKEKLMINVIAKPLTASKRYYLFLFHLILRYLKIKEGQK